MRHEVLMEASFVGGVWACPLRHSFHGKQEEGDVEVYSVPPTLSRCHEK